MVSNSSRSCRNDRAEDNRSQLPVTIRILITDRPDLRRILTHCRTIAVVWLSADRHKASYGVAAYMQRPIAEQAIAVGAACLWQQLGIRNQEADARVRGGARFGDGPLS